ncbi:MAG: dehydrogenase [Caldilineaceae bacterium]|nr:dehydrogenase [Caldilineaceae bacterium]
MPEPFQIGVSADFQTDAAGRLEPALDAIFDPLPQVAYRYFEPSGQDAQGAVVAPADIAEFDGVLVLNARFAPASFGPDPRLAVIARWGVGYDRIDVPACTAAGIALAITVDAVRRPVSEAILTLILALAKRLPEKDRVVRANRWDLRGAAPAVGLRDKVVGSVGLGNIGSDMFRLLAPFGLGRKLAADPYARPEHAAALGVELVDIDTVFRESDFVTVNCPLMPETQGLVNARLLALMKPTAYLINTARGPIMVMQDVTDALAAGRIAGAGLDVFDPEPLPADHPLLRMDNVILSPHSLAWTDDLYRDNSRFACENILTVLRGETPRYLANREVTASPAYRAKLDRLAAAWAAWQSSPT